MPYEPQTVQSTQVGSHLPPPPYISPQYPCWKPSSSLIFPTEPMLAAISLTPLYFPQYPLPMLASVSLPILPKNIHLFFTTTLPSLYFPAVPMLSAVTTPLLILPPVPMLASISLPTFPPFFITTLPSLYVPAVSMLSAISLTPLYYPQYPLSMLASVSLPTFPPFFTTPLPSLYDPAVSMLAAISLTPLYFPQYSCWHPSPSLHFHPFSPPPSLPSTSPQYPCWQPSPSLPYISLSTHVGRHLPHPLIFPAVLMLASISLPTFPPFFTTPLPSLYIPAVPMLSAISLTPLYLPQYPCWHPSPSLHFHPFSPPPSLPSTSPQYPCWPPSSSPPYISLSTHAGRHLPHSHISPSVSMLAAVAFALAGGQEVLPFPETVPETSFSCADRPYGYYADTEANCQVFHICLNNNIWSFLCPNQTLFNQVS
ncbi:hypothetical protein C7M84_013664 [Penaeus vannamei]|uniref:Chitin-binding type-2 domain-containing protein n=1 Tax=Penaeus vannamei TaxID=6689 RepID=A0A423SVH2_PENVA|nr:hypothetical protein C7M84_013664 [Penaeus vannamei]